MDDRDMVSALRSGDVRGLAGVYDRYADRLVAYAATLLRDRDAGADAVHDALLVARDRIGQLRDPDRLRPWLYAIVRTECLHQLRDRRRAAPLEAAGEVIDTSADDPGRDARADELRELVWAAAAALNPGEREVLELSVRHGLDGAELAAALGVAVNAAHAQSSRARAQLERSLGALLVARTGGRDCPELARLLEGWDQVLTPLLRKRLARHADRCEVCGETRRTRLSPVALLAGAPFLPAPAGLRDRILRTASTTPDPDHPDTGTAGQDGTSTGQDAGRDAGSAAGPDAARDGGRESRRAAGRAGQHAGTWRWAADGFPVAPDQRRAGTWRWSAAAVAVLAALLTAGLLLRPGAAPLTAADQILPPPAETTATPAPAPTTAPAATGTTATGRTTALGTAPTTTGQTTAENTTTTPVPTTAAPPVPSPTRSTVPTPPPVTTTLPPLPPPPTTTAPPPPPPPPPAVTTRWTLAAPACPASWRARLTATVTGTTATSVLATYGGSRGLPATAAMSATGRGGWSVLVSLPAGTALTWTATASTADGRIRSAARPLRHDCVR